MITKLQPEIYQSLVKFEEGIKKIEIMEMRKSIAV